MRRLSPRVNVIPVIGKADTLTPSELKGFKKRVGLYYQPAPYNHLMLVQDYARYRILRYPRLQFPL